MKFLSRSVDSTLYPRKLDLVFKAFWRHLPDAITHYFRYLPGREYTRFRHYLDFIQSFSKSLVANSQSKGDGQDVISVLLRANSEEATRGRLSESEVIDQVS